MHGLISTVEGIIGNTVWLQFVSLLLSCVLFNWVAPEMVYGLEGIAGHEKLQKVIIRFSLVVKGYVWLKIGLHRQNIISLISERAIYMNFRWQILIIQSYKEKLYKSVYAHKRQLLKYVKIFLRIRQSTAFQLQNQHLPALICLQKVSEILSSRTIKQKLHWGEEIESRDCLYNVMEQYYGQDKVNAAIYFQNNLHLHICCLVLQNRKHDFILLHFNYVNFGRLILFEQLNPNRIYNFNYMKKFSFYFYRISQAKLTYYRLNNSVQCYQQTSDSPILSISLYLINHFPKMRPPSLQPQLHLETVSKINTSKSDFLECYHPYEQVWNSYLIDLVIKDHAINYQNTLYVGIPLEQQVDIQKLNFTKSTVETTPCKPRELCRFVFGLPQISKKNKKIGIVSYRPTQADPFGVKINSIGLLLGNLYNNESWSIFRLGDNQIPSSQEWMQFSCIVMPGSIYSVLNLPAHISKAMNNIMEAYKRSPTLKLLGLCFGHQIIAQYFGSKIKKLPRIGGIQKVVFNSTFIKQYPLFDNISNRTQLFLSQHHEDFVMSIPQGFKLLASSKSCQIESYISNNKRIFGCQFHGQYFCYYTKRFQKRMYTYYGYDLNKFYVKQNSQMQKINMQDSRLMLEIYRKFIND